VALVMCVALLGGCTISGLEETATRQAWPNDVEAVFGCTPVGVDILGDGVRGSGSGVFVSDRWLLTAAHVVPEGATHAWVWKHAPGSASGMVLPIELIITGGGEPVEAGDWALIRFAALADALDVAPARLLEGRAAEADGDASVLVGFPTTGGPGDFAMPREVVVLRSTALGDVGQLGNDDGGELEYLRMVRGWSQLGGASGGPVVVRDEHGRPGVAGILLGRVEYRGLWLRGRAIVTHAVPQQAFLAARGMLDDLPSRYEPQEMLSSDLR
jgi:hypothetical protein